MNRIASIFLLVMALGPSTPANAQIAGSTTVGVTETRDVAHGWSVRKSILGRTVYNEANEKIGIVQDLVIAPDRSVSYLIVGAGGFVGMGRHDVAIPVAQFDERGGKIVIPGGSKEDIKAMPAFDYAPTWFRRDEFVANAEWDLTKARDKITDLQSRARVATDSARSSIEQRIDGLQHDLIAAENALGDMKEADARRWKEFEKQVAAATARLRRATLVPIS